MSVLFRRPLWRYARLLSLLVLSVIMLPVPAEEAAFTQLLVPKEVYVGDTAQLSYSFQSPVDFYALAQKGGGASRIEGGILYFDISDGFFQSMESSCTVTQLSLRQVGMTYTFVLSFIPWRPGKLEFIPL